jgi:hypothetical protein
MKLKILKKTIKEGENYCIKSLFCSFDSEQTYNGIVSHLKSLGAKEDKISSFCKPSEYNGVTNYAFGLNCSNYTFDRVKRFGVLDAKIIFSVNEKGYCNAKIQVVDHKEQINEYNEPEEEVSGWNVPAPEATAQQPYGDGSKAEPNPITNSTDVNVPNVDLPF